jgi:two-component system, NtrC family, sensor kinase
MPVPDVGLDMARRSTTGGKASKAKAGKTTRKRRQIAPAGPRRKHHLVADKQDQPDRYFNELKEAREQQAATAEILKIINTSKGDLASVFDIILEKAHSLCDVAIGSLQLYDGDHLRAVAVRGMAAAFEEFLRRGYHVTDQLRQGFNPDRPVHSADLTKVLARMPDLAVIRAAVELGGIRTALSIPLVKDDAVLGRIVAARQEVRPFSDHQIALLQNFADQAVIAIENVRLVTEQREALERQTATTEVLEVINSSPGDLAPVFDAMLEKALSLCEASFGVLCTYDGDSFRAAALRGVPARYAEFLTSGPLRPGPGNGLARLVAGERVVHVLDVAAEGTYRSGEPMRRALVDLGGARTTVTVPLLKDNKLLGAFIIFRQEVRPFTEKQIALAQNFAAQAVIAIENTRLLNETREALKQQTATADVLKVISRSTFDLQAVLDTLVQSAGGLCQAENVQIWLRDGQLYRLAAHNGFSPEYQEYARQHPIGLGRSTLVARTALEAASVHIPDVLVDSEYTWQEGQRLAGFRAMLGVPLLRDGDCVGVMAMTRSIPQPFTARQVDIATTFADQAVIAIENVRLFHELQARTEDLRESLQQQTATANVLKVISRSTFDLQTVLQTLVESAARLCDAEKATITRQKEGVFYRAESFGFSQEFMDYVRNVPVVPECGSLTGRALLEGVVVHIADVQADPDYTFSEAQRLGDFRTILGVPMLREGVPVGVLALTRSEVRPFTDKQIELVTTFADQAAIAIENVRLFESVEARTRELAASLEGLRTAQDRLIQTEKLASLGQLTAGIAHEIKNPLNFVNNFSALSVELIDELGEAIKNANVPDNANAEISELTNLLRGNLNKISQHGKRADSIVKNMLLHSREGSRERRPVDLNALVEESLNLAYHGARAEKQEFNITLERSFDLAAGEVELFPQEITRVLLNLISNGVYAAVKRKAEIALDGYEPTLVAATKDLGDSVEIRIRDNGGGISPEVKDKIFNPFFTTKPPGEGTGLGLSLSHDIVVKQHSGSIQVDTQPGEFTEFRVTLPRLATRSKRGGST